MAYGKKKFEGKKKNPQFSGVFVRYQDGSKENVGYSWYTTTDSGTIIGMKFTQDGLKHMRKAVQEAGKDGSIGLFTYLAEQESVQEKPTKKTFNKPEKEDLDDSLPF